MSVETPTAPNVHSGDIPLSLAHDAHRGTSFVPETRARQEQAGYISQMNADWRYLGRYADTEEKQNLLREEFERYRLGYRRRMLAVLTAKSRIVSWMIAGRSNFPARRMQKRNETEQRRVDEFLRYRDRALAAIQKKLRPESGPILSADPDAVKHLKDKLAALEAKQERMKTANAIFRRHFAEAKQIIVNGKKDWELIYRKGKSRETVLEELRAAGFDIEKIAHLFQPLFDGRLGYERYKLSNNNANIRSVKQRIESLRTMKAGGHRERQFTGDITVVEDPDDARIRIVFPEKPTSEVLAKLKQRGFRWSHFKMAWQRHLNGSGKYAVDDLLKTLGHRELDPDELPPMLAERELEPVFEEDGSVRGVAAEFGDHVGEELNRDRQILLDGVDQGVNAIAATDRRDEFQPVEDELL